MSDTLPALEPVMLRGLTWGQALSSLRIIDCAIRRDHWCSPVVVLRHGKLTIDDDGEFKPFTFMAGDRAASDWSMVPRLDADGNEIKPMRRVVGEDGRDWSGYGR